MTKKGGKSRWNKGQPRLRSASVDGGWNRNLQEREHAPTEQAYVDSFVESTLFRKGARIRRKP
jgi:hypothetical protein